MSIMNTKWSHTNIHINIMIVIIEGDVMKLRRWIRGRVTGEEEE